MSDQRQRRLEKAYLDVVRARHPEHDWKVVPVDGDDRRTDSLAESDVDRVADFDSVGEVTLAGTNPYRANVGAK